MSHRSSTSLASLAVAILASFGTNACSKKADPPAPSEKPKEAPVVAQPKPEPKKDSCAGPNDWKSPDGGFCITLPDGYKPQDPAPKKGDDDSYGDPSWELEFEDSTTKSIGLYWGTKPVHWADEVTDLNKDWDAWKGQGATGEVKETIPGKQFAYWRKGKDAGSTFHDVETKLSNVVVKCMVTEFGTDKLDKLIDACKSVRDL